MSSAMRSLSSSGGIATSASRTASWSKPRGGASGKWSGSRGRVAQGRPGGFEDSDLAREVGSAASLRERPYRALHQENIRGFLALGLVGALVVLLLGLGW